MANSKNVIKELTKAYWAEIETTMNYIAQSTNLDGVRAEEIKGSLAADVAAELMHAQALAKRIKELGGQIPGSADFNYSQKLLQPVDDTTDIITVIKGVIDAEKSAINQYKKIIKLCEGDDYVTQDLCVRTLADEEAHRTQFEGFLKEFKK